MKSYEYTTITAGNPPNIHTLTANKKNPIPSTLHTGYPQPSTRVPRLTTSHPVPTPHPPIPSRSRPSTPRTIRPKRPSTQMRSLSRPEYIMPASLRCRHPCTHPCLAPHVRVRNKMPLICETCYGQRSPPGRVFRWCVPHKMRAVFKGRYSGGLSAWKYV